VTNYPPDDHKQKKNPKNVQNKFNKNLQSKRPGKNIERTSSKKPSFQREEGNPTGLEPGTSKPLQPVRALPDH
jgi:hypothetical protein